MLLTLLAWTLKTWAALLLPVTFGRQEKHLAECRALLRMELGTFVIAFVKIRRQIVHQSRRTVFGVLGWDPRLPAFFWLYTVLRISRLIRRQWKPAAPRASTSDGPGNSLPKPHTA